LLEDLNLLEPEEMAKETQQQTQNFCFDDVSLNLRLV
jgi:hypothetical protein